MKIYIPERHYIQLKKLAEVRDEGVSETASFLLHKGVENSDNWIDRDPRFQQFKIKMPFTYAIAGTP